MRDAPCRKQYPDSVLKIGHLSRAGRRRDRSPREPAGERARRRRQFYITNQRGKPIYCGPLRRVQGRRHRAEHGRARASTTPARWASSASIVGDGRTRIEPHLRRHAADAAPRSAGVRREDRIGGYLRQRAAELMMQSQRRLPHAEQSFVPYLVAVREWEGCRRARDAQPRARRSIALAHPRRIASSSARPVHPAIAGDACTPSRDRCSLPTL